LRVWTAFGMLSDAGHAAGLGGADSRCPCRGRICSRGSMPWRQAYCAQRGGGDYHGSGCNVAVGRAMWRADVAMSSAFRMAVVVVDFCVAADLSRRVSLSGRLLKHSNCRRADPCALHLCADGRLMRQADDSFCLSTPRQRYAGLFGHRQWRRSTRCRRCRDCAGLSDYALISALRVEPPNPIG